MHIGRRLRSSLSRVNKIAELFYAFILQFY
ncbi:MAG: hypothetical protein RLZZ20_2728, partial [Pseudomonadota bacterium]